MAQWCRLLPLLLAAASVVADVSSADTVVANKCSLEAQQFSVVVATSAPLGLRLSDKLEVLEFVADSEGRGRAVEASGLAEIGDRLIAVNDVSLEGVALQRLSESCKRRRYRAPCASRLTTVAASNPADGYQGKRY